MLRRKFFIEENRRILVELRDKDLRAERGAHGKRGRRTARDYGRPARRRRTSELENTNRKLEEALDVTRAITSNAAEALLMVMTRGIVSFVNPAAEALFGFERDELLGQTLSGKLIPPGLDGKPGRPTTIRWSSVCEPRATIKGVDAVFLARNGSRP